MSGARNRLATRRLLREILGAAVPQSTISVTTVPQFPVPDSGPHAASLPETPVYYGPGSSSGTYYTDKATVTAVQKKLKELGFFPYTVDGRFGKDTNAAIYNYTATYGPPRNGPPDDELLKRLGLSKEVAFTDDEVDSMVVQAKTSTTPAQVQTVAAKIEKLTENASPEVKTEVAAAKQAAAQATTPAEAQVASEKLQKAVSKLRPNFFTKEAFGGLKVWQVMLGGLGTLVAGVGVYKLATRGSARVMRYPR